MKSKEKIKSLLKGSFIALALVATTIVPAHAASKTISTDRGNMEAWASGFYLSPTKEKRDGIWFSNEKWKNNKTLLKI